MVIDSAFRAPWWLRGAHAQTFWAGKLRRKPAVQVDREDLTLPDGDFVELCWNRAPANGPIVLLLHGLAGSIDSAYARGLMHAFTQRGVQTVLMHQRGCGGRPNRMARAYHSGETGDLESVIAHIQARHPGRPIRAAGVSLGANILLCHLGWRGAESPLDRAVSVCPPLDLARCAARLSSGASRVYTRYLLRGLRDDLAPKDALLRAAGIDPDHVRASPSLRAFDDRCTAPLHGFDSADHYYAHCSSRPLLQHIRVPTWVLFARDDPFSHPSVAPSDADLSAAVTLELSQHGGHVGFVSGLGRYYLDARVPELLLSASP